MTRFLSTHAQTKRVGTQNRSTNTPTCWSTCVEGRSQTPQDTSHPPPSVLQICSSLGTRGTIPEVQWVRPRANDQKTSAKTSRRNRHRGTTTRAWPAGGSLSQPLFEVPRYVSHQPFHPSLNSASFNNVLARQHGVGTLRKKTFALKVNGQKMFNITNVPFRTSCAQ